MIIYYSEIAKEIIANYFDSYMGTQSHNDMLLRAYHYSRIRACLSQIHALDTYEVDGKNFVDIDDICSVEYALGNDCTEIVVLSKLYSVVIASVAKQTSILYFWFASGFALAMTIRQCSVNMTVVMNIYFNNTTKINIGFYN